MKSSSARNPGFPNRMDVTCRRYPVWSPPKNWDSTRGMNHTSKSSGESSVTAFPWAKWLWQGEPPGRLSVFLVDFHVVGFFLLLLAKLWSNKMSMLSFADKSFNSTSIKISIPRQKNQTSIRLLKGVLQRLLKKTGHVLVSRYPCYFQSRHLLESRKHHGGTGTPNPIEPRRALLDPVGSPVNREYQFDRLPTKFLLPYGCFQK